MHPEGPSAQMYPFVSLISPVAITQPKSKRRQVKKACTNCQKACKKCDDARPCLRCVKYGVTEGCIDSIRKERKKGIKRGPYKKRDGQAPSSPTELLLQGIDVVNSAASTSSFTEQSLSAPDSSSAPSVEQRHSLGISTSASTSGATQTPYRLAPPASLPTVYPGHRSQCRPDTELHFPHPFFHQVYIAPPRSDSGHGTTAGNESGSSGNLTFIHPTFHSPHYYASPAFVAYRHSSPPSISPQTIALHPNGFANTTHFKPAPIEHGTLPKSRDQSDSEYCQ